MSAPRYVSSPRYTLTLKCAGRPRLVLGVVMGAQELGAMLRAAFDTQRSHGAILRLTSTVFSGDCRWRWDGTTWRRQSAEMTAAAGREGVTT